MVLSGLIILVVIIVFITIRNRFIMLHNKVEQSKSGIDVYLTKRFDLIPNLVETVKGYMKYEEKVYTELTEKRTIYMKDKDLEVGSELNKSMKDIFAVAEKYPELKASENFLSLQKALKDTEGDLEAARRLYNSDVTVYNNYIQSFPYSIFAGLFGYNEPYEVFKASEEVRSSINISI